MQKIIIGLDGSACVFSLTRKGLKNMPQKQDIYDESYLWSQGTEDANVSQAFKFSGSAK